MRLSARICLALTLVPVPAAHAQTHSDGGHAAHPPTAVPTQPGQAAYGAIAEVVSLLTADPRTDWSRVDIERLRRHLIDMDEVTMRAAAVQSPVTDGARFVVTGEGPTRDAIRRMTRSHATELTRSDALTVRVGDHPDGAVVVVTARQPGDAATAAMIRGLGFAGLMALGDHHGPHHLAIAFGGSAAHGGGH